MKTLIKIKDKDRQFDGYIFVPTLKERKPVATGFIFIRTWINASARGQRGLDMWVWKDTGQKVRTLRCMQIRAKFAWKLHADYSSLTRIQSRGATSCGEKVGGGGDHYLGFREFSFVWHLPLKTLGSKKSAENSSELREKEVAWLLKQCLLMSISLCLSAGSWRWIEWEGSCCQFI